MCGGRDHSYSTANFLASLQTVGEEDYQHKQIEISHDWSVSQDSNSFLGFLSRVRCWVLRRC